jgi:hydroxyacylglutathione hydrolase
MNSNRISVEQLSSLIEKEPLYMLDTRPADAFVERFIPGSVSAGSSGKYDKWIVENIADPLVVLISEAGNEDEAIARFQTALPSISWKVLDGGFEAWEKASCPLDMIIEVEADELALDLPHDPSLQVIDLRGEEEFEAAHVTKAQHIPLAELIDLATIANFDEDQQLYLHCGGGQRSILAASLIKKQGVHNLRVVAGGFDAIQREKSIPITQKPGHS